MYRFKVDQYFLRNSLIFTTIIQFRLLLAAILKLNLSILVHSFGVLFVGPNKALKLSSEVGNTLLSSWLAMGPLILHYLYLTNKLLILVMDKYINCYAVKLTERLNIERLAVLSNHFCTQN